MSSLDVIDNSPHHPDPSSPIPTASNLILIDNYDSFTWNVYQYLVLEGAKVTVFRNDKVSLHELVEKKPTQLVISPGPGHPTTDSGISRDAIRHFAGKIPIFGVCMGQQCIIDVYGGQVSSAGEILHGKTSLLSHNAKGVYKGLPQGFPVTRYHSLAGTHETIPKCLEITSWVANEDGSKGVIQGVRHNDYTVEGVQFHPESILSAHGRAMVKNFLHMQGGTWAENERLQKSTAARATPAVPVAKNNNILRQIYARRKLVVAAQKQVPSQRPSDLQSAYELNLAPPQISFVDRLRRSPFDVALLAEIKRASPSKGVFALDMDAPSQARKYALAGASVISVLTEPEWFKGSLDDLRVVRQALGGMPDRPAVLRKEFVFDEYQILEARLTGADTVLLIVKMLEPDLLSRLYRYSRSLGMEPLVEVQNADEMKRAIDLGANVIGVNNRNLENFEVDLGTTGRLRSMVPESTILCALSGISSHQDVLDCKKDGVSGILVGEAIMRAPDASQFIQQLCTGVTEPAPGPRSKPIWVKICGTRTYEGALAAVKAGADLVGMIMAPGFRRAVTHENALAIAEVVHKGKRPSATATEDVAKSRTTGSSAVDFFTHSTQMLSKRTPLLVGVFCKQSLEEVLEKQRQYRLDVVQLHGDEPVEWANLIPVPVIRKFAPSQPGVGARGYHALPLLDSGTGSGKLLEAEAVKGLLEKDRDLQVLLAGGLDPDNVAESLAAVGPLGNQVLGVDVSSGVETDGQQDMEKIRAFVQNVKAVR